MKTVIDVSHSTALAGSRHRGARHSLSDNVQNKRQVGEKQAVKVTAVKTV